MENILKNVPLHDKNWFQTGGLAKYYCEPTNEQQFVNALKFTRENNLEIFVLGEGANILISDEGFDGLVIRPMLKNLQIKNNIVTAGAGIKVQNLIDHCLDNNLLGLEEFSGIPGTVGGSVFINIHYFEFLLSQFITNAKVINVKTGEILDVEPSWFNFGYNTSKLHEKNFFLLSASFILRSCSEVEAAYAKGRRDTTIRHRNRRYPTSGTCGSFFRNFYENEVPLINGKKIIYVAYYLDKVGIKGELSFNDACVSYLHANMIVNNGSATTNDIISLVKKMQELVFKKFQIVPTPECRLIGFKKYPLHTNASILGNNLNKDSSPSSLRL